MTCVICNYGSRYRICETCGNDIEAEHDPSVPWVVNLQMAYGAMREPADYPRTLEGFRKALASEELMPSFLRMATWFEYGMAIVKSAGGGPLKRLQPSQLGQLTEALETARARHARIPADVLKQKAAFIDYEEMIRSNLAEAARVMDQRESSGHPPAAAVTDDEAERHTTKARTSKSRAHRRTLLQKGKVYWISLVDGDKRLFKVLRVRAEVFDALPINAAEPSRFAGDSTTILFSAVMSVQEAGLPWSAYGEGGHHESELGTDKGTGGCFIATAVYGSCHAPEVLILRAFRDEYLLNVAVGRWLIKYYYLFSPPAAAVISSRTRLRAVLRIVLDQIAYRADSFMRRSK